MVRVLGKWGNQAFVNSNYTIMEVRGMRGRSLGYPWLSKLVAINGPAFLFLPSSVCKSTVVHMQKEFYRSQKDTVCECQEKVGTDFYCSISVFVYRLSTSNPFSLFPLDQGETKGKVGQIYLIFYTKQVICLRWLGQPHIWHQNPA